MSTMRRKVLVSLTELLCHSYIKWRQSPLRYMYPNFQQAQPTDFGKNQALINHIRTGGKDRFDTFIDALIAAEQGNIVITLANSMQA